MQQSALHCRRGFLGWVSAAIAAAGSANGAAPPRGRTHRYEELLPEQFYEELARAPIAYWACGAMEEHGLQSPLGADPWIAYEVCLRAVAQSGGVVFPIVPFAPAGIPGRSRAELRKDLKGTCPPSLWTSRELCKELYAEIMESMADLGFKVCMAQAGHWPAQLLLAEMEKEMGGRIGPMKFSGSGPGAFLGDVEAEEKKKHPERLGHGLMQETSMIMAAIPGRVELDRARRIDESPLSCQLKNKGKARIEAIASANAAYGNRLLDLAAARVAKLAKEMLG